ncbi:prolipoprotein diacylglyceryl transferase [Entomoplasma freundtii]|uniref:Prolipoprotein diacylglyceryl transferase n=1 Tax=Entomoplasma freundtii TaxID=74700 RepID=A0A2K8NU09_9MOLU|nr:prolipoprotein diacylglyceryl transferase family protein [Entomoplasma freundtii]ATZ16658.1 prolipoprotein diacylglyceryl transferase [Entomoplasma freundtii]TDY58175.1 prolipoprotein diacylglyceryl transferase [Entomoplasma freundtii]
MTFSSYLDWINQHGDPSNARLMFGIMPAYPIFMFSGILLVIIASIIKLKMKGIPLREFEIATVLVVPAGALGASIFGKIFLPGMVWYHIFFFWEPGMSLFGGLLLGSLVGFVWFYRRSKTTLISIWVYADCIIPNLLLGQMLGRWGNFYNHEILGQIVSYDSLRWLPNFIRDELFYFPNLTGFDLPGNWAARFQDGDLDLTTIIATSGIFKGQSLFDVLSSPIEYRAPLFLIEGIGCLILWFLITLIIPKIGYWFSQTKPWDLEPKAYPGWFNKKYKYLPKTEIIGQKTLLPIKYRQQTFTKTKAFKNSQQRSPQLEPNLRLSLTKAWQKAYYWQSLEEVETRHFEELQLRHEQTLAKLETQYKKAKLANQRKPKKMRLKENCKLGWNHKKQQWVYLLKGNPNGRDLEQANNPHRYLTIRCGVQTSCYLIGYLILRIILETQRLGTELMIPEQPIIDFILLSLILTFAICLLFVAQLIAPYRYREVGWLYEKSY